MEEVAASTAGEIGLEESSIAGRLCQLLSGVEGQRRTYMAAAACWPGRAGWEGEGRNVSLTYEEFSEVYVISMFSLCFLSVVVVSMFSLSTQVRH